MGWWPVDENGKVIEYPERELQNAIPGKDDKNVNYMGDVPLDVLGDALDNVAKEYQEAWGRPPKAEEILILINSILKTKTLGL